MKIGNMGKGDYQGRRVDRPSVFGNPFKIGDDGDRNEVCRKYDTYFYGRIRKDPLFKQEVEDLKKEECLLCWCAPQRCHAETIRDYLGKL